MQEFDHDESWDCLTEILSLNPTVGDAWKKFIDFHHKIPSSVNWDQLRSLDTIHEQKDIVEWLENITKKSPVPAKLKAFWIGIVKFSDEEREIPTIYISGSEAYVADDIDWASTATYLPENRYAQPQLMQMIDNIILHDQENYAFLDWIVPLAYCAFTFDEIFRSNMSTIANGRKDLMVSVGYDGGDYVEVGPLK